MSAIPESELVINPDGSVYHLNLRPEEIASTIITVGDPGRVAMVSKYFDEIEVQKQKREFLTHTGRLGKHRLTVISSGIGTENIDILINELDALANIDFASRTIKDTHQTLEFIRIGTSGALHEEIPVGAFVASAYGVGLDNLMAFYALQPNMGEAELTDALRDFFDLVGPIPFYACQGSPELLQLMGDAMQETGITMTSPGFYAPQGRELRLKAKYPAAYFQQLARFQFQQLRITNFEMETSAIYGLSRLLGHRALSTNVILANRASQRFSTDPKAQTDALIQVVLEKLAARSTVDNIN
jgi:uridine phosphorylase